MRNVAEVRVRGTQQSTGHDWGETSAPTLTDEPSLSAFFYGSAVVAPQK